MGRRSDMTEPIQEIQRQNLGDSPPPQGYYTAYELELSRRVSNVEKEMALIVVGQEKFATKSDLEAMAKTIVSEIKTELNEIKVELRTEFKTELNAVKTELKADINVVKADINVVKTELNAVKTELNAVKTELKADINVVKADINSVKTEVNAVKTELKADIKSVKNELKADINSVDKRTYFLLTFIVLIFTALIGICGYILAIRGDISDLAVRFEQETKGQISAPQTIPAAPAVPNAAAVPMETPSPPAP
jgi:hypothetical protein